MSPNDNVEQVFNAQLYQNFVLKKGGEAKLQGTSIKFRVLQTQGPSSTCSDCPVKTRIEVRLGNRQEILNYGFSGNMVFQLLKKAKRKKVFDYVFVIKRITNKEVTLRIEPSNKINNLGGVLIKSKESIQSTQP